MEDIAPSIWQAKERVCKFWMLHGKARYPSKTYFLFQLFVTLHVAKETRAMLKTEIRSVHFGTHIT